MVEYEILNSENFIEDFKQLKQNQLVVIMPKLNKEQLDLLLTSGILYEIPETILLSSFLRGDDYFKHSLLNDELLIDKLMKIRTSVKKCLLDLLTKEQVQLFLMSKYSYKYPKEVHEFLYKLPLEKFIEYVEDIDFKLYFTNNNYYNYISHLNNYNIETPIKRKFSDKVIRGKRNPIKCIKLSNKEEFDIYTKFDLITRVHLDGDNLYLNGLDKNLSKDLLYKLNEKQMKILIRKLKTKGKETDEFILFVAVKLYITFGFDNSYKILNDKFSNMTIAATNRASDYLFKDKRREYRLQNQGKFYYYGLENKAIEALENNDVDFFKAFSYTKDKSEIEIMMSNFASLLSNVEMDKKLFLAKEYIINMIKKREDVYRKKSKNKNIERIKKKEKVVVNATILYYLLCNIEKVPELDENGRVLPNINLIRAILGNCKKDNDCILRLVLNKEASGLNDNIHTLVNDFDKIEDIIKKSSKKLSYYSILDLIDILKAYSYNLEPDLQDITLDTLSKILKSREYCTENQDEILNRTIELHRKRKKKVFASIPIIKGEYDGIEYFIPRFDADYLLTAGIDSGDCLKVGGKGEELLEYCLTSPHGAILYLKDENGNRYNCPIIRTGNGIHGNGIDPEPPEYLFKRLLKATEKAFEKMGEISNLNEDHELNIEYATITDLHQKKYMKTAEYDEIVVDTKIPLDASPYSDYNKREITKYLIYKKDTFKEQKFFESEDKFYQERPQQFIYDTQKEYDQERIQIYVDLIRYTYMKSKGIERFDPIDLTVYKYIIGNNDWYLALDDDYKISGCLLPYDERAKKEYLDAYRYIPLLAEKQSVNNGVKLEKRVN